MREIDGILRYGEEVVEVTLSVECTSIKDSYRFKSRKAMRDILGMLRSDMQAAQNTNTLPSYSAILSLPVKVQVREWRAHNLLYALGYKRERTGSVDIDLGESRWRRAGYFILSCLYWHW